MWHILRYLPFMLPGMVVTTVIITYVMAVTANHVYPYWPYISDTGTFPPESCIFTLLLSTGSVIMALVIYIMQLYITEYTRRRSYIKISKKANIAAAVIGYLGVLGLGVVASFQETSHLLIHLLGAAAGFGFFTIYFFILCVFTFKMKSVSKGIFWIRVVLASVSAVCFFSTIGLAIVAGAQFKGKSVFDWRPKDGGHGYHVGSTVSEWILALALCLYVSTFYCEFRRLQFLPFEVKLREESNLAIFEQERKGMIHGRSQIV